MYILKTRLYKPILKPFYITRRLILDYLESRAVNTINLVIAAAGYGKSVTISQWLDHKNANYGWISLDPDCNDMRIFLDYLVCSFQNTHPESLQNFHELVNAKDLPSAKVISDLFINEILEFDEEFVLVLDDYHLINNPQIHLLISEILKFPSYKLKVFILSRKDPPLMISSLKAYDLVNEIRMSELKFDESELIELSEKTSEKPVNHEIAKTLVTATEGWIIALKLALQSIDKGLDPSIILSHISSENQTLAPFLMDEIIYPQSETVRDCLLKTSILSRFCEGLVISLCTDKNEEKIETVGSNTYLFTEITDKTLFVIPLDSEQIWFRFHHLFSEVLHKQLEKQYTREQIADLHVKASKWFERNGFYDEAIIHAVKANDLDFTNQIIENRMKYLFDNEQLSIMNRWLKIIPAETRDNYLAPTLIYAFLCDTNHDYLGLEKAINTANKILVKLTPENDQNYIKYGYYYALQSILFYKTGRIQESFISSANALKLLETENSLLKDAALLYHAFVLIANGRLSEADKLVIQAKASIQSNDQLGQARNSLVISHVSFLSGNLPRIQSALYPIIDFYNGKSYNSTRAMSYYYLGFVEYQWNQLKEAALLFDIIWEHRFSSMPRWILHHVYINLLTLKAQGEKTKMMDLLDMVHQYIDELGLPVYEQLLACIEVEFALSENDFEKVNSFQYKADFDHQIPYCFYYVPQFTRVKLKLKEGGFENFQNALTEIIDIVEYLRKTNNATLLIQALILQAVILKLQDNIKEALKCLSEAVKLAKPGGFLRVFVEMGKEIRDLFLLYKNENKEDSYVDKILNAFPSMSALMKNESDYEISINKYHPLIKRDDLTQQEIEILKLAAIGLQNKEIAEKLFLSPNSIKKYLYFIFKKLEVNKRSNAIEKAKHMNII